MKCVIKFFLKGLKLCQSESDSKKNIGHCQHYVMAICQICKKNCTSRDICRTLRDFSHTNTSFCAWYQNLNTVTFFWCGASIYSCPSKRFVANSISPLRQRPNATASVGPPVGAQRLSFDSRYCFGLWCVLATSSDNAKSLSTLHPNYEGSTRLL